MNPKYFLQFLIGSNFHLRCTILLPVLRIGKIAENLSYFDSKRMLLLAEKLPNWSIIKEQILSGKMTYYQAEKQTGIKRANIHYAVNRPEKRFAKVCPTHGIHHYDTSACTDEMQITIRKKPKSTSTWKKKPPPCESCGKIDYYIAENGLVCNNCLSCPKIEIKKVPEKIIPEHVQYKY